jgi:Flp pilus assembly protein CpaB
MAEPVQGIQNKWLLIIAGVLALVVVLLYNAHIQAIKSEQQGQTVAVVQMAKDLPAGERITALHIKKAVIPKDGAEAYGKIWRWADRDVLTVDGGQPLRRNLHKGEYLLYDYVEDAGGVRASRKLGDGMVGITIEFDRDQSLGDMLSPGDTVNLKAVFATPGGVYKTYRMLSDVRVMNVGGVGASDETGGSSRARRSRNYKRMTIEVTPDV